MYYLLNGTVVKSSKFEQLLMIIGYNIDNETKEFTSYLAVPYPEGFDQDVYQVFETEIESIIYPGYEREAK